MFEYSWGQFIARQIGAKVYNFSRGGMTAIEYVKSFADANDMWSEEKLAQTYIVALGCNDLLGMNQTVGSVDDLRDDYTENPDTFAGWYGKVIQRYMKMQPRAKFFLMTMVRGGDADYDAKVAAQAKLMRDIAAKFDNTYVIDLEKYGPVYDEAFREILHVGSYESRRVSADRENDNGIYRLYYPKRFQGFQGCRIYRNRSLRLIVRPPTK